MIHGLDGSDLGLGKLGQGNNGKHKGQKKNKRKKKKNLAYATKEKISQLERLTKVSRDRIQQVIL